MFNNPYIPGIAVINKFQFNFSLGEKEGDDYTESVMVSWNGDIDTKWFKKDGYFHAADKVL